MKTWILKTFFKKEIDRLRLEASQITLAHIYCTISEVVYSKNNEYEIIDKRKNETINVSKRVNYILTK